MIRWGAERPAVIWALAAGVVISGGVAFTRLPLATKGTVEYPTLTVSVSWSGASPELVETYLIAPMEGEVQGVRGVRNTESTASEGSGTITIHLDPAADVTLTRLAILERKESLQSGFPPGATVDVVNYVPDALKQQPLLEVNVVGPFTPGALANIVHERVIPTLTNVPGIGFVGLNGGADNGLTISYDPARLHQLDVDPSALQVALANARQVASLGSVHQGTLALTVSVHDEPRIASALGELPVSASNGRVFRLGDIAAIRRVEDSHGAFYRLNGQTAVTISMFRLPAADAIKTAQRGREAVAIAEKLLPQGVHLSVSSDSSEDLSLELRDLMIRGSIAFAAVFLVLFITLRSLSGGALVIGSAGIAIAGAALSLYLLGIPANLLTLAGLGMGIGILVQNGLVVVERLRAAKNTAASRAETGRLIAPAVLGSTLTTTVVLLPFLYLQGNARALFAPFAGAFALALFWSVGTSLVFVPAVGRGYDGQVKGWPRLARLYARIAGGALRWRRSVLLFTVVVLGVLTWGFIKKVPRVDWGRSFGEDRQTVSASVSFPRGSDPVTVEHIISELESEVVGLPGVTLVRSSGGATHGNVVVEFSRDASLSDAPWTVSDKLTERAVLIGGTDNVSVSRPEGNGFYNSSGGSSGAERVTISGYSYRGVLQLAVDLKDRLEQIPRVRDVNINAGSWYGAGSAVSVSLTPDRGALGRLGASVADFSGSVGRQISGGSSGQQKMTLDSEQVNVTLRAAGAENRDMADLTEGLVSNPERVPVRIGDISRVGEVTGLAEIVRKDQQYIRVLSYDFRGPQKMAERTHKAFMQSITTPPGYTVTDANDYRGDDGSSKGLLQVFLLGTVLVLLAVALVFNSVWAAGMVLLALPMALGGVIAAFWITGTAFTREAAVGVILVVGLAVNHSILLIDAALDARRKNGGTLTLEAALHAATDRVTMIVLVTLTTLASLAPMAIGTKSDTIFGAIALATAGGTVAGTLGVMFVMPALLMGKKRKGATSRDG